jgi:hypothetical protein
MAARTFIVRMKAPDASIHFVVANEAFICGDQLILVDSENKLAALFVVDFVESWCQLQATDSEEVHCRPN